MVPHIQAVVVHNMAGGAAQGSQQVLNRWILVGVVGRHQEVLGDTPVAGSIAGAGSTAKDVRLGLACLCPTRVVLMLHTLCVEIRVLRYVWGRAHLQDYPQQRNVPML